MKILLFGGAFNPVHNQHVAILRAAVSALGCDKVIIMPTAVSPHKTGFISAPPADRLQMCRIAFGDIAEVSDYEVNKGGASFSYITCEHLARLCPGAKIYFLMGADMLACFSKWVYPERILKLVTPVVCAREGSDDVEEACRSLKQQFGAEAVRIGYTGLDVSSTRVRALAALGKDISSLVPAEIAAYVSLRGLYRMEEAVEAQQLMKKSRAEHTVRVACMAAENCRRLGVPERKAVLAAALHDAAKNLKPDDKLLQGFVPPEGVPESVMHQFSGAYLAEHHFGITDRDVLDAIRYHTSGRPGMSPLEKLIFLSDMLEEGRDFKGVEELRAEFFSDVDGCLEHSLRSCLNFVKSENKPLYPLTMQAYEYIRAERAQKNGGKDDQ